MEEEKECASCVYFLEDESGERCLLSGEATECCRTGCPDWLKYDESKLPF